MEKRRSKRKSVQIDAELISGNAGYAGLIDNISENGICMETASGDLLGASTCFNAGKEFQVKFRILPKEEIKLHCKVIWSFKAAPHGLKMKIGMDIIFPPPRYVDFYRNFQQSDLA